MAGLTPRARAILEAVEREVAARLEDLEEDVAAIAPRRVAPRSPETVRPAPELLAALELGVAGVPRAEVAERLRDEHGIAQPEPLLDAVFGAGSPPRARLHRAAWTGAAPTPPTPAC